MGRVLLSLSESKGLAGIAPRVHPVHTLLGKGGKARGAFDDWKHQVTGQEALLRPAATIAYLGSLWLEPQLLEKSHVPCDASPRDEPAQAAASPGPLGSRQGWTR